MAARDFGQIYLEEELVLNLVSVVQIITKMKTIIITNKQQTVAMNLLQVNVV